MPLAMGSCQPHLLVPCHAYIPTSGTAPGTDAPAPSVPGSLLTASCCAPPAQAQSPSALHLRPYSSKFGVVVGGLEAESARRRTEAGYSLDCVHAPGACVCGERKLGGEEFWEQAARGGLFGDGGESASIA